MAKKSLRRPIIIEAERQWSWSKLVELVGFYELLFFFVWRDLKVRYKQTILGAAWVILQPLITAAVFTVFFGKVAGIESDGHPYIVFSYAGLILWLLFAQGTSNAANSLIASSEMISKVFLPRIILPISAVLGSVIDFGVSLPFLIVLMVFHGASPSPRFLLMIPFVFLTLACSLGTGLWLSALNVRFRDIRYIVPFFIQLWLFLSPVIYPAESVIPVIEAHRFPGWIYGLNPMVGALEGFRWAVLGGNPANLSLIAASISTTLIVLSTGFLFFSFQERSFADVV